MLQENFTVLGFYDGNIYFKIEDRIVAIKKNLPKEDLILKLKVEPEDAKELKDEILVQASKSPLTEEDIKKIYVSV